MSGLSNLHLHTHTFELNEEGVEAAHGEHPGKGCVGQEGWGRKEKHEASLACLQRGSSTWVEGKG